MKVLLSSIGSRGDVQPILALARELTARGHEATLCVAPNFKSWVESHWVRFVPIGPDLRQFTMAGGAAMPSPEQMRALAIESVRNQFKVIRAAAEGCYAIVAAGALQIATRSVAEMLDVPYRFTAYAPVAFPSLDHEPAKTTPGPEASATNDNRKLWEAEAARWNQLFLATLNEEREKSGLASADDIMRTSLRSSCGSQPTRFSAQRPRTRI